MSAADNRVEILQPEHDGKQKYTQGAVQYAMEMLPADMLYILSKRAAVPIN